MQWTKWEKFCAQLRPNRRSQVSGFNNLRNTGRGFDSHRPLTAGPARRHGLQRCDDPKCSRKPISSKDRTSKGLTSFLLVSGLKHFPCDQFSTNVANLDTAGYEVDP